MTTTRSRLSAGDILDDDDGYPQVVTDAVVEVVEVREKVEVVLEFQEGRSVDSCLLV